MVQLFASCETIATSLHRIPLLTQMSVQPVRLDDAGLLLQAPLAPNRNHMGTGFGGSQQAIASAAGWALVLALVEQPDDLDIVIQESRMEFFRPVTADFDIFAVAPDVKAINKFKRALNERGRARIRIQVEIRQNEKLKAMFTGMFVALLKATQHENATR